MQQSLHVEAPYEVKVNLDPVTAQAAFAALVNGVTDKPRSAIFYKIKPKPHTDTTIVRARRDAKNKTDITVKLRDIPELVAWVLLSPWSHLEEVGCEVDIGFTGNGKLSCDVKIETSNDTSPLDGASVKQRLDESQRALFLLGTGRPAALSKLVACPTVETHVWKGIEPVDGCTDDAVVEIWSFNDGLLYELSCNTTTLAAARAGLQARMDALGILASPDQRGKTERSLAQCPGAQ